MLSQHVRLSTCSIAISQIFVRGYDPKDSVNYGGYQGTFMGYPFLSATGAKCMVKVTGTEGFLECMKLGKKTSAGYNDNYAQYEVMAAGASCSI